MIELFYALGFCFPFFFNAGGGRASSQGDPTQSRFGYVEFFWAISARHLARSGRFFCLFLRHPRLELIRNGSALFVGTIGIAFGLCSAVLIGRSVGRAGFISYALRPKPFTEGRL